MSNVANPPACDDGGGFAAALEALEVTSSKSARVLALLPEQRRFGYLAKVTGAMDDLDSLRRERDLYRQLLEVGNREDPAVFVDEALSLFIALARAKRGYIELRDLSRDSDEPTFSVRRGMNEEELTPRGFSRTVIAEAYATGETVSTASASDDLRFGDKASVKGERLQAVLCTPIGRGPTLGVIYLQDRSEAGPFSEEDRALAVVFARHLAGLADRLLWRSRRASERDRTLPLRQLLKLDAIVGSSDAIATALQQVALVAPLNVGVLLTGATGTGKTQFAQTIHINGPRRAQPFIEVNCAALPDELVENELFGAVQGGHSTATKRVQGKVQAAEGGTLFLDEIGDLPLKAQGTLLQLLQSGTYYPIGGSTPQRASVRVIAATNADLAAAVAERRFREDLYYRLSVFPIRLPSLAERREDIPLLAAHLCRTACESEGISPVELSEGAISALEHADWPGNVRSLAHFITAGVIRAHGEGMARVERRHLFSQSMAPASTTAPPDRALTFHESTRRFQERLLRDALEKANWNIASAARSMDLTRAHIYNLMANFGVRRPDGAAR